MADQPPNDLVPVNGGPPADLVPVTTPAAPTADAHPRWDIPGDIGRAALGSGKQFATDIGAAFPSGATAGREIEKNRDKYGLVGGALADQYGKIKELGHFLKAGPDAVGAALSPATGAAHGTIGSALSYPLTALDKLNGLTPEDYKKMVASPNPWIRKVKPPKEAADEAIDQSLLGLGPRGMSGGASGVEAAANAARSAQEARSAAKVTNKAIEKINKRAAADDVTAQSVMDAQAVANAAGNKSTLLDMGKNLQGLGGSVYRVPGKASAALKKFLDARVDAQKSQLAGGIEDLAKGSSFATINRLYQERSAASRPLYDEALSVGPIRSDRITQFFTDPEFQSAVKRGIKNERREATAENRPFKDSDYAVVGWNEAGDPIIGPTPTMKTLALAKEGMDARLEEMRDPVTGRITKDGLALKKFRDAYLSELDAANPKYKAAREAWSGPTQSAEAVRLGRDHFKRGETDAQVRAEFDDLSAGDKEFYRLGAAESKLDQMNAAQKSADKSKRIVNSDKDETRFRMLFKDKDTADRFINSVEAQRTAFETRNKVSGGSPTAERLGEDQHEGMEQFLKTVDNISRATSLNPIEVVRALYRQKRDLGLRPNPALNAELVRILTDPNLGTGSGPNLLNKVAVPGRDPYLGRGKLTTALGAGAFPPSGPNTTP